MKLIKEGKILLMNEGVQEYLYNGSI